MELKRKKSRLKQLVVVLAVILCLSGNAYAMDISKLSIENNNISPRWSEISDISIYVSAEGRTVYPEIHVKSKKSSGRITGTMYLEKYSNGRWVKVTSWDFKGTSSVFLSKSYNGTYGNEYRARAVVSIDGETTVSKSGSVKI